MPEDKDCPFGNVIFIVYFISREKRENINIFRKMFIVCLGQFVFSLFLCYVDEKRPLEIFLNLLSYFAYILSTFILVPFIWINYSDQAALGTELVL